MHDQAKYEPYEESAFFDDGTSARQLPANTIPRGFLREDREFYTGFRADRSWVEELPLPLDAALLDRGEERFGIYCTPCHDRTGGGGGMIVQRGFKAPPPLFEERVRQMPIGYYFDVMTNGFGVMSSYAAQVKPHDRWAIAAWIRVLQAAQATPVAVLTAAELEQLESGAVSADAAESPDSENPDAGNPSESPSESTAEQEH